MSTVVNFAAHPEWLKKYYERGFRLIFYPQKQKGPSGQEAIAWTDRADEIGDWKGNSNVGTFTGQEIQPNKFLVDIDFDWGDGLPLARGILPATGFGFGRESRVITHSFYTTEKPIPLTVFKMLDGKKNFVEVRGTKTDGTVGIQTMLPPSIHPNGEELILRMNDEIGHYDAEVLMRRITLYAVACLVYSVFANGQLLHDSRLALAGFLLGEGLSVEEASMIAEAVASVSGNNVADAKLTVKTTAARIRTGEHVQGKSMLAKAIGDHGKAVISRIKEWLGSSDFKEDHKGKILANDQDNVRLALEKMECSLSFDIFSQKPLINYPGGGPEGDAYSGPLVDTVVRKLWLRADDKFRFRPSKDFFYDVVENSAYENKFHPVLDYLKSLEWDGVPRLNTWIIHSGGAADTDYVQAVSALTLIAAVRRVTKPGCKFDEMIVLESQMQGLQKSTALRTLCPKDEWFSDDLPLNVDAKQIVERTLGKWIIEASDLSGMASSQVEHLKGMLSRQVDGPVRLAYGRLPVEQPRQFIIVGTTNSYTYLTDSTGNRRFWPIRVQKFDVAWIRENRDQIWAEAFAREQMGATIRLDPSLYSHATMQQERRRAEDPWELKLEESFPKDQKWRLTPDEVWAPLGISIDRRDPKNNDRVLKAMHKLGFKRTSIRDSANRVVKGFARDKEVGQFEIPEA
jgi:hypothetical protein